MDNLTQQVGGPAPATSKSGSAAEMLLLPTAQSGQPAK
jgi:hypothetical protein